MLLGAGEPLEQVEAEPVVQFRRGNRTVQAGADQELAYVQVGLEQHRRREEDVVDADDAFLEELDVVQERRAAVQREVQRVVQVVVQVCAGRDQEVDQAALHQLDDAAAKTGRRQRPGDGEANGRVVLGGQHFLGVDLAGLVQPPGVERLEAFVDQLLDLGAARRTVVLDWLPGQKRLA